MFKKIMVPVDLNHTDKLTRALEVAATLARAVDATVVYTGVGAATPGTLSHNPKEFSEKLEAFAETQSSRHGHPSEAHAVISHDPAVDLNENLVSAAKDIGADVIVMASHVPGVADHWFHGHAAHVAQSAPMSVLVVR